MLVSSENLKEARRENLLGNLNEFQGRIWRERGRFEYAGVPC